MNGETKSSFWVGELSSFYKIKSGCSLNTDGALHSFYGEHSSTGLMRNTVTFNTKKGKKESHFHRKGDSENMKTPPFNTQKEYRY